MVKRAWLGTVKRDSTAFSPTDEAVAKRVGVGKQALPALVLALEAPINRRTVRVDRDSAAGADASTTLAAIAQAPVTNDPYHETETG